VLDEGRQVGVVQQALELLHEGGVAAELLVLCMGGGGEGHAHTHRDKGMNKFTLLVDGSSTRHLDAVCACVPRLDGGLTAPACECGPCADSAPWRVDQNSSKACRRPSGSADEGGSGGDNSVGE
jgi:hypothetical protein